MTRPYETMVVFDGSLPDDVLAGEQAKLEEFLKKNGEFEKTDIWGKRQLAYSINKKRTGYYCLFQYASQGDLASKLDRQFKLNERVLRYLTLRREPSPVSTEKAETANDAQSQEAPAAVTEDA